LRLPALVWIAAGAIAAVVVAVVVATPGVVASAVDMDGLVVVRNVWSVNWSSSHVWAWADVVAALFVAIVFSAIGVVASAPDDDHFVTVWENLDAADIDDRWRYDWWLNHKRNA